MKFFLIRSCAPLVVLTLVLATGLVAPAFAGAPAEAQVLFVCEHGNVKSLMAASYFNQMARERRLPYRAVSRGSAPDSTSVPPAIVDGLRKDGVDVASFHPAAVDAADISASQHLVLINTELPANIHAHGVTTERWGDVPPASVNFEAARDALRKHVAKLIDELASARGLVPAAGIEPATP
jgi:arsenate reductase